MWERRDSPGRPGPGPGIFDPAPLNPKQIWVLCAAALRQLAFGLPAVSREVERWRLRARSMPDPPLRADALHALADKRPHLDGAALFWILPRWRNRRLLALLVAYEIALEFLDNTNERAAEHGTANGRQLHLALPEALLPGEPVSDHYLHHPWTRDGGYLRALVESCRRDCASLPRFELVRAAVSCEARRTQVLALNHEPDPARRAAALQDWARRECPGQDRALWFELSAAATASLTVHVLLALGAEAASTAEVVGRARAVYFPGLSLATTMLDSYVDRAEDEAGDGHSYIAHYVAHYGAPAFALDRLAQILERSIHDARALHRGERHAVLAACMVALYLSRDSAREEHSRLASAHLLRSGGSLARLLLPVLRLWRIAYALRSA